MLYTNEEINEYRAGWLETHPDEVMDTDTVISCLNDERKALMTALIKDDMTPKEGVNPMTLFEMILQDGCKGYTEYTFGELWEEMNARGLTL